jgi:hypothetical protein
LDALGADWSVQTFYAWNGGRMFARAEDLFSIPFIYTYTFLTVCMLVEADIRLLTVGELSEYI